MGAPFQVQAEAGIGCGACAAMCPTGAVQIESAGGPLSLVTWNTTVPLPPCPECGQPFAPEPMSFLQPLAGAGERPWGAVRAVPPQAGCPASMGRATDGSALTPHGQPAAIDRAS